MAENFSVDELLALAIEQRNQANESLISTRHAYEADRERYRAGFVPNVFGHQMYINPRDPGMALGSLEGQDIGGFQGEVGYFQQAVRAGHRVLDLGANVGLFTLLFARAVGPTGKVYAFEPGPLSFLLLSANVYLNSYRNVVLENAAVADRTEELVFFVSEGESDCRIDGTVSDETGRARSTIRGVAMDDYFSNGETVDIIKMDIQGAEPMALRGMEKLLARSPNVQVVMELMPASLPYSGRGPGDMLAHMQHLGFKLYDLPEHGVATPITAEQLLKTVGPGLEREMTNLVLRRF